MPKCNGVQILAGLGGAALSRYLIAKIFGPLLFGRLWCGWACWTLMILDLLPYPRSKGRIAGKWGWLRYAHFALSLGLVLVLWSGSSYQEYVTFGSTTGLYWMIAGNALYYMVGISMAFILKDNRAFCKYVYPIAVFLKATSRFSLLKIKGDVEKCNACGACVENVNLRGANFSAVDFGGARFACVNTGEDRPEVPVFGGQADRLRT